MNRLFAFAVACGLAACSSPAKQPMTQEQMIAADPLPLARGAKWTYNVAIKRYDAETDKESTKTLTWTTEVLDAHESNGVVAYRVKGWPADLATDPDAVTPVPTERTLLRSGNNFLFGAFGGTHARRSRGLVHVARDRRPEDLPQSRDGLLLASGVGRDRLFTVVPHRSRRADVRYRARHGRVALPLRAPRHDQRGRRRSSRRTSKERGRMV